jgi:hypothetical protein
MTATEANMTATETADSATATPVNAEVLRQRIRDLDQAAADGRARLQILISQRQRARGVLADAISAWQGVAVVTHEANARQYIANEIRERQRLAKFGPDAASQPSPGNSVIDRSAAYGAGGNASDFARKQMRSGFRRGAYPGAMKSARLPSNRA